MSENEEPPAHSAGAGGPDESAGERLDPEVTGLDPDLQSLSSGMLSAAEDLRRQQLCEAALAYAARGFRVIPVRWVNEEGHCSCPRGPECPSPAKHPVHDKWPEVSTCDPMTVAGWWRPEPPAGTLIREWFPLANIGLVTGRGSNMFVLDVDTYAGGGPTLGNYERRHGPLPETRVHSTGSGGTHFFFAHPGFDIRNSAAKTLGTGLDIRGENGFVVAPPSVNTKGAYELNPAHDIDPAPAPDWLLALLRNHDKMQNGSAISGAMPTEATGAARRYVQAAVQSEAERLRDAPDGRRNDTLNECAFSLGTLGGAGLLSEEDAFAALREAALAAGLGDGEIRGTFISGWKAGMQEPRRVQWKAMGVWPARPRTGFGLADRMADHFGDLLRFCPERDTWMVYRNGVWVTDTRYAGEWYAQAMIRSLPETEALSYDDMTEYDKDGVTELPSPRAMFLDWVAKQQTNKAVGEAAKLSRGLPLMRMSQSTFDADPILLNVRNGVVDLATGELRPHEPEARMTLQCNASYLEEDAPMWEKFLRTVQPDPEMRAYVQRVAGYCATGLTIEQVFFLMHGSGANGKGVFQNVLAHVLGSYAQTIPVDTLTASSVDGRIPNDVARMAGRRYLVASETKQGAALDEARLKALTGGDTISARYMRAEWFEFQMVGKIQLTTNHLPRMSDDSATWRRIHLLKWPVIIPEHERDGFLQQNLIRYESAGILRWIIQGAIAWHQDGLNPPASVYAARAEYQRDEDYVAKFIEDCLDVVPPVTHAIGRDTRTIWNAYKSWALAEGYPQMGQRALTSRLKLKHAHARSNGWSGFPELQIKMDPSA